MFKWFSKTGGEFDRKPKITHSQLKIHSYNISSIVQ